MKESGPDVSMACRIQAFSDPLSLDLDISDFTLLQVQENERVQIFSFVDNKRAAN
jgi:hypothetical protein